MSAAGTGAPTVRIERGNPDPREIAAVLVAVGLLARDRPGQPDPAVGARPWRRGTVHADGGPAVAGWRAGSLHHIG